MFVHELLGVTYHFVMANIEGNDSYLGLALRKARLENPALNPISPTSWAPDRLTSDRR